LKNKIFKSSIIYGCADARRFTENEKNIKIMKVSAYGLVFNQLLVLFSEADTV